MRTFYVTALDMITNKIKIYSFPTPQYGDTPNEIDGVGFYRTITSLNAFFHARGAHYRNWTDKRLFTLKSEREYELEKNRGLLLDDGEPIIPVPSLFGFYREIGYDRVTKKYTTGEKMVRHQKH
jgi:hypothetical protein